MNGSAQPEERNHLGDVYDKKIRSLEHVPDVTKSKATTIRTVTEPLETLETYIVQTYRHRELGDTVSIEFMDMHGHYRIALPPSVVNVIIRQRDALSTVSRKRAAKAEAARRKAAGIQPGFLKKKGGK